MSPEQEMITEQFDQRTMANLSITLELACRHLTNHDDRRYVAEKLMQSARAGRTTASQLNACAMKAITELQSGHKRSA
jgi:hypothetical protein